MDIICTVAPNTLEKTTLNKLRNSGGNIIRLNFSHFSEDFFREIVKKIRKEGISVNILGDIQGSKIRVWSEMQRPIRLLHKELIKICSYEKYKELISLEEKLIPLNLNIDNFKKITSREITFQDGAINLQIVNKNEDFLIGKVKRGGIVRAEKSCNIKGYIREEKSISTKDKRDIDFCLEEELNIIALSYIESKEGLLKYKNYILNKSKEMGKVLPKLYAKIETFKGVENIKSISEECDGIIIARGDLVPEVGINNIPIIQRMIFKRCKSRELIVATHLLDSLVKGKEVSPAEVDDIYWFIKNGATGFLLAKETTITDDPSKAVNIINKLINKYS
ncbi:pyruvate kinase [Clostridium sp. 'White wine YQ']|uniref:pyruvate kinase n=1 Tax=Clostridium sp. 'White wine YQ' TaxID=3027474 RepID=UPI002365ED24|nr:pyruvate kinase [Clostridium sp. 'White wine YQ']MDD7793046.1 pyruvate kinase [Clostridium sp. 'White wine YQ']